MLCQICGKNAAVIFINKMEGGKLKQLGVCLSCAKEQGLQLGNIPGVVNIPSEELQKISEQMNEAFQQMSENGDLDALEEMLPDRFKEMLSSATSGTDDDDADDTSGDAPRAEASGKREKRAAGKDNLKNLKRYSTDLTQKARDGEIDPIIGREKEIDRMVQILNRRTKNNPVLIGEPGVGKTAIADGLALRIVKGELPPKFADKKVFLLDLNGVVAGTQFRGQFEARLKAIIDEVIADGNCILVVDEIHNLVGAGDAQGSMNAANILKPALADGSIQVIGTTTLDEYRKYIEKDSALERRFQPIIVDEPSPEDTIEILKGLRPIYEQFHNVFISDEVIEDTVYLSQRYIHQRFLPDKAIDILDEAASAVNLRNTGLVELEEAKKKLADITKQKDDAAEAQNYEEAARLRYEETRMEKQIQEIKKTALHMPISYDDVAQVVEGWTKIPVKKLTNAEAKKLLALEENLHKRVIGQDQAVTAVAQAIRRNRSGFRKEKKPASFIFSGPTGVGKTELVKTLAIEMFGSEDALIRIDMSEYMEKHTVSRLVGAPPGYIGYGEGGQLTEKVRRRPFSVILLDEIEKAHADIFNLLLQILDDGRITDSEGRTVNFENTIIVMTTNAGSASKNDSIGFGVDKESALKDHTMDALKKLFRPEFLNRIDDIITFHSLTKDEIRQIVDLMLKDVYDAGARQDIQISVTDEVKAYLAEHGYDEAYGARPLRRLIQKKLEDLVAEAFLKGDVKAGDRVVFILKDDEIVLNQE